MTKRDQVKVKSTTKRYAPLFAFALAVVALTACGGQNQNGTASQPNATHTTQPTLAQKKIALAKKMAQQKRQRIERAAENAANEQENRVAYYAYWSSVTKPLAEAHHGMLLGLSAAKINDSVTAWKDFSACASLAETAGEASVDHVPGDWAGNSDTAVGENLTSAASGLKDACQGMASYVDDQKPSDLADEQSNTQNFVNGIVIAAHSAKAWYVRNGGKASDLMSDLEANY